MGRWRRRRRFRPDSEVWGVESAPVGPYGRRGRDTTTTGVYWEVRGLYTQRTPESGRRGVSQGRNRGEGGFSEEVSGTERREGGL